MASRSGSRGECVFGWVGARCAVLTGRGWVYARGCGVYACRDYDIGDSVQCLRYYAGWADKIAGQVGPSDSIARIFIPLVGSSPREFPACCLVHAHCPTWRAFPADEQPSPPTHAEFSEPRTTSILAQCVRTHSLQHLLLALGRRPHASSDTEPATAPL